MNVARPASQADLFFRRFLTICRNLTISRASLALVAAVAGAGRAGTFEAEPDAAAPATVGVEHGDAVTLMRRAPQPN
jgi:hypothetical protein